MEPDFINLTEENLAEEHLCCIIRSKSPTRASRPSGNGSPPGSRKAMCSESSMRRRWFSIEYAPLETAWVPVLGGNYIYLYCLWVDGGCKGKGYGRSLMEYCLADAKRQGRSGVCMLGAKKQKGLALRPGVCKEVRL